MNKKSVLYFGSYEANYSRNRIVIKGLKANKVEVLEAHASGLLPIRYFKLARQFLKHKNHVSSIIVGFPGHYDVPLAYIAGRIFNKQIFYDIFASNYETYIMDRKVVKKKSFRAKFFFFVDWLGLKLADYVIVDSHAHANFYKNTYGIGLEKQIVVYLGSDNDFFSPKKVKETTDVLFYGSYQPLQGVNIIIKAASLLPKVKFKMIGDGQTKKSAQNLAKKLHLKNILFVPWIPLNKLATEVAKTKIGLGIFGGSQKANVVIPNKVFDSIACKKPVITADTLAIRELFQDKKNIYLVKKENPIEVSSAIEALLKDKAHRDNITGSGFNLYNKILKPELVVRPLLKYLNE